jgi:hypothetical protein
VEREREREKTQSTQVIVLTWKQSSYKSNLHRKQSSGETFVQNRLCRNMPSRNMSHRNRSYLTGAGVQSNRSFSNRCRKTGLTEVQKLSYRNWLTGAAVREHQ